MGSFRLNIFYCIQTKGRTLDSPIGVGRFRIFGGQGLEYWGPNSKQAHGVVATSYWRQRLCIDVISTSCAHLVFNKQYQIITFLILKSDIIENSRIELRGIVLPVSSNQIKVSFIVILPFNLVHWNFFLFHIEIEGKCVWIILGGGGGKGYVGPLSNYWGPATPPPPPPPGHPLPTLMCPLLNYTIASPILSLPLDPTRWSNLAMAFYVIRWYFLR